MKQLAIQILSGYKRLVSPMLPAACRYVPTCSEYAVDAVEQFGVFRGGAMTVWRVLRCNPFVKGGVDPVTQNSCCGHQADGCGSNKAIDGIRVLAARPRGLK